MGIGAITLGAKEAARLAAVHSKGFEKSWSADEFAALLANGNVSALVLQSDGLDVGMALLQTVAGESEILTLCILPVWRGKGLGYHLLHACCDGARVLQSRTMFLEVSERNAAALSLYSGFGFTEIGRRSGYYDDNSDALIMSYSL